MSNLGREHIAGLVTAYSLPPALAAVPLFTGDPIATGVPETSVHSPSALYHTLPNILMPLRGVVSTVIKRETGNNPLNPNPHQYNHTIDKVYGWFEEEALRRAAKESLASPTGRLVEPKIEVVAPDTEDGINAVLFERLFGRRQKGMTIEKSHTAVKVTATLGGRAVGVCFVGLHGRRTKADETKGFMIGRVIGLPRRLAYLS